METGSDTALEHNDLRKTATVCALLTVLTGVAVLGGWACSYFPGPIRLGNDSMNPVAAVLFIAAGAGLYCHLHCGKRRGGDKVAFLCGGLLVVTGLAKFIESVFHYGPWLDQLLFASKVSSAAAGGGNVLAPNAVLNFVLCGFALILLDGNGERHARKAQPFILAAGLIALLAVIGYSYDVISLYKMGRGAPMALLTAMTFLLWCGGAFAARPGEGVMQIVTSNTTGGAVARRLLPMAILIPWLLGVLRWTGENMGLYRTQEGVALFTIGTIVVFTALVWWTAKMLHKADLERIAFEDRLRKARANLERSNTELQQFAYMASHDLYEPLRMITSYLDLLQQTHKAKLDDSGREFIGFAVDGAARMRALIDDLLAYSRVEARGQPFQSVDCNLAVDAALQNLKIAIAETQATIERSTLPEIKGDLVQITQLFQNLIGNAIKFKGASAPLVSISVARREGLWEFAIEDNGIGISPEHFTRIFEIFQRLHTRRDYPGTGMGLAICKKIVERHGGRIWVESAPQKGSAFKFTLPAS